MTNLVSVALSVDSEVALLRLRGSYLSSATDANLIDFGSAATARRKFGPCQCMTITADSASRTMAKLSTTRPILVPASKNTSKKIVFLLSDQGGRYLGMDHHRQFYQVSQKFHKVKDKCHVGCGRWTQVRLHKLDRSGLQWIFICLL